MKNSVYGIYEYPMSAFKHSVVKNAAYNADIINVENEFITVFNNAIDCVEIAGINVAYKFNNKIAEICNKVLQVKYLNDFFVQNKVIIQRLACNTFSNMMVVYYNQSDIRVTKFVETIVKYSNKPTHWLGYEDVVVVNGLATKKRLSLNKIFDKSDKHANLANMLLARLDQDENLLIDYINKVIDKIKFFNNETKEIEFYPFVGLDEEHKINVEKTIKYLCFNKYNDMFQHLWTDHLNDCHFAKLCDFGNNADFERVKETGWSKEAQNGTVGTWQESGQSRYDDFEELNFLNLAQDIVREIRPYQIGLRLARLYNGYNMFITTWNAIFDMAKTRGISIKKLNPMNYLATYNQSMFDQITEAKFIHDNALNTYESIIEVANKLVSGNNGTPELQEICAQLQIILASPSMTEEFIKGFNVGGNDKKANLAMLQALAEGRAYGTFIRSGYDTFVSTHMQNISDYMLDTNIKAYPELTSGIIRKTRDEFIDKEFNKYVKTYEQYVYENIYNCSGNLATIQEDIADLCYMDEYEEYRAKQSDIFEADTELQRSLNIKFNKIIETYKRCVDQNNDLINTYRFYENDFNKLVQTIVDELMAQRKTIIGAEILECSEDELQELIALAETGAALSLEI